MGKSRAKSEFDRTFAGRRCRVLHVGSHKFAAQIEYEDGTRAIVRRRSLRKVKT